MNFAFLNEKVTTGENQVYLDWILSGAMHTALISAAAFILALVIGIAVGVLRTTGGRQGALATVYFEIVRSVPFMAQLFIAFFVVPVVFFPEAVKTMNQNMLTIVTGTLGLAIFMSGRVSAQVYAGLQSLPRSQKAAATALGFNQVQTYTHFLLPQALRNILPTLTSEAMNTVKNSAVISTIGLMELSSQAKSIIDYTAQPLEAFTCIIVGYLTINMAVLAMMNLIERTTRLN